MTPSGSMKKVRESYLIRAVNFTDAETSTIKEIASRIDGELGIDAISKVAVAKIISHNEGHATPYKLRWYKVIGKGKVIDLQEGRVKPAKYNILVKADSVEQVMKDVEFMNEKIGTCYEIESINESKIAGVFPTDGESEETR